MNDFKNSEDGVFRYQFTVPPEAIDLNGHVNNVTFVQWMQEVAIRHSDAVGGTSAMRAVECFWVVRSHKVEYLAPGFAGDIIEIHTWVQNLQRVRSLRQYRFVRVSDSKLLVRGETDWVFVRAVDGRPVAVPDTVKNCFRCVDPENG